MIPRARTRLRVSGFLLGCLFILLSVGTDAAAPSSHLTTATASGVKISAHLTKTSFKSSQAGQVKLIYKFSKPSKSFGYLLTFKKGSKWQTVKSVKKRGSFKGSHKITVKKVFAGKPVKVGKYRLKLSADGGRKLLSFKVLKAKSGGLTPTGSAPTSTALPTTSGTTTQGQTLTAAKGSWSNSPTSYAYQWRRCSSSGASCSDISSAASSSYILILADVGLTIRVVVTASNSYGSASATSSQTAVVVGLPPANTSLPTISGTTTQGQTLTASNGSWSNSPTSYTYQWRRCNSSGNGCADISGASSSSYVPQAADVGSTIRVVVTATNAYGSASATSNQTAIVAGFATAISGSGLHTCVLLSGGTVWCWGSNSYGQLGNGTTADSRTPVQVSGITNATAVSAGGNHTCALLSGGTIKCWGANNVGQLGNGETEPEGEGIPSPTPVSVSGISTATAVSVGDAHTCALLSDHTVKCWGYNHYQQLGNGAYYDWSSTPVQVGGITNATAISAGFAHTCALLSGGAVECWGANDTGQLGNGSTTASPTPVQVGGITNATAISAGKVHTCALLSGGTVKCWGQNFDGELGNGTTTDSPIPVQVSGIANAVSIGAGGAHTCAALADGTVACWGDNEFGQLGNGTTVSSPTPVQVSGIANAVSIGAGDRHTCALLSGGAVKCWGANDDGQLGNGTPTDSPTPVSVIGFP
jgi:alpha-tubulin suppressor-like RCC1 family protein